jgi:hypothetical protein
LCPTHNKVEAAILIATSCVHYMAHTFVDDNTPPSITGGLGARVRGGSDKLLPSETVSFPETKSNVETIWDCSQVFFGEWFQMAGEEPTIRFYKQVLLRYGPREYNSFSCVRVLYEVLHDDLAC